MDIISHAMAKREKLRSELEKIDSFLATAFELEQEAGGVDATTEKKTLPAPEAAAPAPRKFIVRLPGTGLVSATANAAGAILRERGVAMSTRELLPLIRAKGIEVGGKDPLATLSARLSNSNKVKLTSGKWWLVDVDGQSVESQEAADAPTTEQSAAPLFNQARGGTNYDPAVT